MGLAGLYRKPSSHVAGVSHRLQYALNRRLSRLSVILPPYCTSETMYWKVVHDMGPLYRCFSRKRMQALRSPLLYSYGMHQPREP